MADASSSPWRVNTSKIDPDGWTQPLLQDVLSSLGWHELKKYDDRPGNVILVTNALGFPDWWRRQAQGGKRLPTWTSRYDGSGDLCEKNNFAIVARVAQRMCPRLFHRIPETWTLPAEMDELKAAFDGTHRKLIVKPGDGSQGDGIFFAQSFEQLKSGMKVLGDSFKSAVAQTYVENPLLLGGLKFDLRLYICVIGLKSPRAFLCREGLARFATAPYVEPDESNKWKWDPTMHLTNYSLNKGSAGFVSNGLRGISDPSASKRPLSLLMRQLKAESAMGLYPFDEQDLWKNLEAMAADVVAVMLPVLRATCGYAWQEECHRFQIFGMDVLLDEEYQPWFLEVNSSPSLSVDQVRAFDEAVDAKGDRCSCSDSPLPHIHEICEVDLHVKGVVLGCALQLLREHVEGLAPLSTAALSDPYAMYGIIDLSRHPYLRCMEPIEALWARGCKGKGMSSVVGSTSVELQRVVRAAWHDVLGQQLPAHFDLRMFAGALRRNRFARSGTTRLTGPAENDSAQLHLTDFAEFVIEILGKCHDCDPKTQAPRLCDFLLAAFKASSGATTGPLAPA